MAPEIDSCVSSLNSLKSSFDTYLYQFTVTPCMGDTGMFIEYTIWMYDLIDADLDINEEYYANICDHFRRWLFTLMKDIVVENQVQIICIENTMVFRNVIELKQKMTLSPSTKGSSYVNIVTEIVDKVA